MEKFEDTIPATVHGIKKYLGSGFVKGIGPKFAQRIVRQFGKDTLDVIEETPDRLLEVAGIGKVRVERIKKNWAEQKKIKNIIPKGIPLSPKQQEYIVSVIMDWINRQIGCD